VQRRLPNFAGPELLIVVGGCAFIFVLGLSAYFEPDIRWLHFFQAWMYVATIALSIRRNRWGYFIGISAAAFWDYLNLFVTTFFPNGVHWLAASIRAGQAQHVDQIIAVPAWIANFLMVAGCIWAYARLQQKKLPDLARFGLAIILTTGFFATDVAIFQPRYLPLFRRALHPRSPLASVALPTTLAGVTSPFHSQPGNH
jgi:hypothetical protein